MKHTPRRLLAAAMALTMVASFAPSGLAADQALRIASVYPVTTLDPSRSGAAGNAEAFGQLYSRLLRRDAKTDALEPGLAESWDISEDRLIYTFHIRDVSFSDGTPLTAEDARFSLERVRSDPESALPSPLSAVESIEAPDERTLVLKLKYPLAPILDNLELWNLGIVSKDQVEKEGEAAFTTKPRTTGPYAVKEWRPGEKLVLEPNPHYWRTGYPLSKATVELLEIGETETSAAMLKTGDIQVMRGVNWSQVKDLMATDGIDMRMEPSNVIFVTLLNHGREPFSSLEARQAAAQAIDNKLLTETITFGFAQPANTTLPGSLEYHDKTYPGIPYNLENAKELLAKSGMVGREVKILLGGGSTNQQIGLYLQAQWTAIGLKPVIVNADTPGWWEATGSGNYDAAPTWWLNEITDPDLAVRWALCGECDSHSFNTFYNNPVVNDLTEKGAREVEPAKRAEIYAEIQRITTEEVTQIPLYYSPFTVAYSDKVFGLRFTRALQWTLEDAQLAE